MKLKTLTSELIQKLNKKLSYLENQTVANVFLDQSFPKKELSMIGLVENLPYPTWYTEIQDILEKELVHYEPEDIENNHFLGISFSLSKEDNLLFVYFQFPDKEKPTIELGMNVVVKDEQYGTFTFKGEIISHLLLNKESL